MTRRSMRKPTNKVGFPGIFKHITKVSKPVKVKISPPQLTELLESSSAPHNVVALRFAKENALNEPRIINHAHTIFSSTKSVEAKIAAAEFLANFGKKESIIPVLKGVSSANPLVSRACMDSLKKFGDRLPLEFPNMDVLTAYAGTLKNKALATELSVFASELKQRRMKIKTAQFISEAKKKQNQSE